MTIAAMASNLQVLHVVPLRRLWSWAIRLGQVIWAAIPEGSELPDRVWRQRHRGILVVLWLHAIGIACFSLYTHHSVGHSLLEGGIIAATALGAAIPLRPRTMQASVAALGLIASSAVLVHLSGGYIEFHFHFFVMVGLLALYQEWAPFLFAIGFVLLHHGVVGVLDPSAVYNHPAAIAHPWRWAGIHALFIAAMSVVSLITWRVNETTHALAQLLLTSAGEGIIGLDRERRVTFVNEAALKLCEWDPHPPIGEPLGAVLSIVDNGEGGLASAIRERRAIPGSGQETLQRRHGSTVPIEYVSTAITERGQIVGTVLLLKDVTERQRLFEESERRRRTAEASARAVRDNEERIRLIIETSLEAVITMDADGSITGWNPQAERVFGWALPEVLGRSLGDTIVPERNREAHRRGIQHFLATGVGPVLNQRIEVMALHRDGREFPVELTISAAQLGSTVLFSWFVRDLTDRKRAERRQAVQIAVARVLAETTTLNEWVSPLLEAIGVSTGWDLAELWTVDAEAHVLRWGGNWHTPGLEVGAFETISQDLIFASGADVPGRVWATVEPVWMPDTLADLHPARAAAARQLGLRAALGFPVRGTSSVTAILVCFSRSVRPSDDDLLAVMEDVSSRLGQFIEQQRAQEALHAAETHVRQLQRLEAVGRLAGGVAHDFNNLLTVILGRGAILLSRLPADHPLRRDIELMKKTAERAAALTKQLLAFSRKQMLAPKVLDLNTVVSGITTMLQRLIGEDIELVFRAGSGLGRVKADPGQIEQVIANLVVNARDALPDGGHLTIETANVELGEHYARQHVGVQAGSYVMLGVSDTGTGMDRETQARIFEPFFTTKEPGKGTGLGLSTVYGIVKQSGGNIWVYSEPGTGTTFKVYLPLVHDAEDTAELAQVRPGRGTETILVVEDEDDVRALACEVLATYGYEVLQARMPAEALLIAERHPGPVQLLLTDVVMPGMSGRMLAERLAPLRPEMKILYMSGYTDDAIVHHGTLDAGTPFIQKPFLPDALAGSVRRVLDTAGIAVE